MISPQDSERVRSTIRQIEEFVIHQNGAAQTVGAYCKVVAHDSRQLRDSPDSLAPVLRTALVINWRESAMKKRYERFRELFPEVTTLAALKHVMDNECPLQFCKQYLDINANKMNPENNPKYQLLKQLVDGFLEYQQAFNQPTEIDALRHWASRIQLSNLKSDSIGKRYGVGKGVVENIRLNLGYSVLKPDRHVIGVMKDVLQIDIPLSQYNEFADFINVDRRYFDCLLFEYGKAKKISA